MNVNVFKQVTAPLLSLGLILLSACGGGGAGGVSSAATTTITWAQPAAISYGTALSSTQLDATANNPGTITYSPAAGTVLAAGTQTLTATFTPTDSTKATSATATTSIVVNKAASPITWAAPPAVNSGTALSSTQLDATSAVAGAFTYSPAPGTVMSTAGTVKLTATFTPTDSADYAAASASVNLTVNGPVPSYAWSNVKIVGGGYITGLYFHPTQQNLMYVRTDVGGAYRRGPADTQWVPLLDFTSKDNWWQLGVEALGLDPTDANKLYVAVGEYANENWDGNGAMLVSSDQGKTFTTVNLAFKNGSNDNGRNCGERIAVDPNKPSIVYFGTRLAGLQISTDAGMTWAQSTGLNVTSTGNGDGVVTVLPIPASGSSGSATPAVYAAVAGTGASGEPVGFYVTTAGGSATSTWTAVSGQPSFVSASTQLAPLQAKLGPDGAIYILYGDQTGPGTMTTGQLWKFVPSSSWTSGTWTQITLPNQTLAINISNGYGGIAVDPSHPGHLLLGTLDQYWPTGDVVYLTTDDGVTWRDVSSVKISGYPSASPGLATHDSSLAPWLAYGGPASNVSTGNWATAIAFDPFNADHAVYAMAGTIWDTTDINKAEPSASSVGVVDWSVAALGIEETVINGLWAPPSGKTILLSSMGDLTGFAHQDLTLSPPQQMFSNPQSTPASIDFEQGTPTTAVRVTDGTNGASPLGSISTDAGLTWAGFAGNPTGTAKGGGTIAIASDGSSIVWAPEDTSSVWYSKDQGKTWTASTGITAQAKVVSDRVKAGVFYGLAGGTLTISTDGGATFTTAQSGLSSGTLVALPDAQGDLWLAAQSAGLYTNTGTAASPNLTSVSSAQVAYHLAFGASANGATIPTLYLDGSVGGTAGIYRSIDGGSSWTRINDNLHQWGGVNTLAGDMRTFGTIYVGTPGRGIVWGTSAQ